MSRPQPSISIQFGREWKIRRPLLYRYLDKVYVDEFFATGKLRMSSFSVFASHEDEERLDKDEGAGMVVHRNSKGQGQTLIAVMAQGHSSFVLCGSTNFRVELAKAFNTNSGFRINDTLAFSEAISRYVPGFFAGIEGPCLYMAKKMLDRDMGPIDMENLGVSPGSKDLDMGKMSATISDIAGDDLLFLKSDSYAHQNEYRLLWFTPSDVNSHIDIVCPEARQFCTRFEDMLAELPDAR